MIFKSRRAFEETVQRRIFEEDERRMTCRRMEELQTQIDSLRCDLFQLRMKTDAEFRQEHQVTTCNCGSDRTVTGV